MDFFREELKEGRARQGGFPDPFRTPPSALAQEAKATFKVPEGFNGRVGCLVCQEADKVVAFYALCERKKRFNAIEDLSEELLWPPLSITEIEDSTLYLGTRKTLGFKRFLLDQLSLYPQKDYFHGGKEIAWRKGELLFALKTARESAAFKLLNAFNKEGEGIPLELVEWQVGEVDAHEIYFDGTFYAPLSSGKVLIDLLTKNYVKAKCSEKKDFALSLLYEDEDLIAVNKPAKLPSLPSLSERFDAKTLLEKSYGTLYDVHRLDMGTSGLLLFAKDKETQALLHEEFRGKKVKKTYVALLDGVATKKEGVISLPIGVNRLDRPRQCVVPEAAGGKSCVTTYKVVETQRDQTRVALFPETGRTHQLRVHMAHPLGLGLPIVGDAFYGRAGLLNEADTRRLMLHARAIDFTHPKTGKNLHITCEEDF